MWVNISRYSVIKPFQGCSRLSAIIMPKKLATIGASPFASCRFLVNFIVSPFSSFSIGESAFVGCLSLQDGAFIQKATEIGKIAFAGCSSLASAHLASHVVSIEEDTFVSCTSLESVELPSELKELVRMRSTIARA